MEMKRSRQSAMIQKSWEKNKGETGYCVYFMNHFELLSTPPRYKNYST